MDLTSLIGFLATWILVVASMASGGNIGAYIDIPSLMITIGGAIGAVVLVRNAIINLFLRFNEKAEDNGDIVMSLDDDEIIKRPGGIRKRVRASGPLTERERIRREYKKRIKESTEDQPNVSNTPAQLEEAAGLADDPDMRELHVKYEDARYSKEE